VNFISIISVRKEKNGNRCTIEFEDGSKLSLHLDIAVRHSLGKGKSISFAELQEITEEERTLEAKNIALNFATKKLRTTKEVIQKLKAKNFEDKEIHSAITFLKEFGYLDDREYIRNYIKYALEPKKHSLLKVRNDLQRKGIDREIIDEELRCFATDDAENDNALQIARKKLKQLQQQKKDRILSRIAQYLATKGFSWETINRVCESLKIEIEAAERNEFEDE
jgi:regulatory protein